MKEWKLEIDIERPVEEVFLFSIDPHNSPKWIDSFGEEVTSAWPVALGTVYRNRGKGGPWNSYTVTAFEENKVFELTSEDGGYCVRYIFEDIGRGVTRLRYHEWVKHGELDAPFGMEALEKLKGLIEEAAKES